MNFDKTDLFAFCNDFLQDCFNGESGPAKHAPVVSGRGANFEQSADVVLETGHVADVVFGQGHGAGAFCSVGRAAHQKGAPHQPGTPPPLGPPPRHSLISIFLHHKKTIGYSAFQVDFLTKIVG